MNLILYKLCRHCVDVMGGYYPMPSTLLSKDTGLSLYKTRKELKALKNLGLVISDRYCVVGEDKNYLLNGYTITEKAKDTEEYKTAYEEEKVIFKKCFGYELDP